jgi:uncharacterized NAD-dependent epimerase/dehydratase family protein
MALSVTESVLLGWNVNSVTTDSTGVTESSAGGAIDSVTATSAGVTESTAEPGLTTEPISSG